MLQRYKYMKYMNITLSSSLLVAPFHTDAVQCALQCRGHFDLMDTGAANNVSKGILVH